VIPMLQTLQSAYGRAAACALGCCFVLTALAPNASAQDEQQDAGMSSRIILQLQQMREEVREMRGMLEAQAQEIENLKRRQRDQYLDLDRRIGEMGRATDARAGGADSVQDQGDTVQDTDATPSISAAGRSPTNRPEADSEADGDGEQPSQVNQMELPEVRAPVEEQPEVVTLADPGGGEGRQLREPTEAERQAYDQAFNALRETRYADAAEGFDAFLRDHPDSSYAPNAMYWLGEVYYVTRDFETALAQFERLQETYPESSKQPDALLKVGFSHYELGNWDRARAALEQVIADYPGTNYSRLAENRLRTMRLEGNL